MQEASHANGNAGALPRSVPAGVQSQVRPGGGRVAAMTCLPFLGMSNLSSAPAHPPTGCCAAAAIYGSPPDSAHLCAPHAARLGGRGGGSSRRQAATWQRSGVTICTSTAAESGTGAAVTACSTSARLRPAQPICSGTHARWADASWQCWRQRLRVSAAHDGQRGHAYPADSGNGTAVRSVAACVRPRPLPADQAAAARQSSTGGGSTSRSTSCSNARRPSQQWHHYAHGSRQ